MTLGAFFLFSIASSAVYLVNDVWDLESDRAHPTKQKRPIASGKVSIPMAIASAGILAGISAGGSFWLNPQLGWIVSVYLVLNLFYSKSLKHRVLVDVGCIAFFFLLRVSAGSAVSGAELSHWMLFMTGLLALFLGFTKRRQELQVAKTSGASRKVLLQYDDYFIDQMVSVVTASIVVVYMLYTVDVETVSRVGSNHLMVTIPFVYYGIFRYLYLIHKANMEGDPTVVFLSDRRMQINLVLWTVVCVMVVYFGL